MPKCFFFDIDGTLVDGTNTMPESAWKAIETLRRNGHYCFLCSGRNLPSALSFEKPEMDGVIFCSGAGINFREENIARHAIPDDVLQSVYALLRETGSTYILFDEQKGFASPDQIRQFEIFGERNGLSGEDMRRIYSLHEEDTYSGEAILKIDTSVPRKHLDRFLAGLHPSLQFVPTEYDDQPADMIYAEISLKEVSKGSAAQHVMSYLQVKREDSYGFGDSMNDHALLQVCGTAIAMENGADNLKKAADLVAPSVTEDGIARILEQLRLI